MVNRYYSMALVIIQMKGPNYIFKGIIMNKVIILGKIMEKSKIHFNYMNKLEVYFYIFIDDFEKNTFKVMLNEKIMGIKQLNTCYSKIQQGKIVCIEGNIQNCNEKTTITCINIYMI